MYPSPIVVLPLLRPARHSSFILFVSKMPDNVQTAAYRTQVKAGTMVNETPLAVGLATCILIH